MDRETQPLDDQLRNLVFFLWRKHWTLAQIADRIDVPVAIVGQVLREPAPDRADWRHSRAPDEQPQRRVRLTDQARKLQIWLPTEDVLLPTDALLQAIREKCAIFHLAVELTEADLRDRMRLWVYGTWLTVVEATLPQAAVSPQVKIVAPVHFDPKAGVRSVVPVYAGDVLAHLTGGKPGLAGRDLLGRTIAPLPAPEVHLPRGENTEISADGRELLATVDGQAILHNGRIAVLPRTVHVGDLSGFHGVLRSPVGVIVTGSVLEQAEVHAEGAIHVLGHVQHSRLTSVQDSIQVGGSVVGRPHEHCSLRAAGDIVCGSASYADIESGRNITLAGKAHYCTLTLGGDLYLQEALGASLVEVQVSIGGSVFVPYSAFPPPVEFPTERRHTRIPTTLAGKCARYDQPPMVFGEVLMADLSPGGTRCRFPAPPDEALQVGSTVELKMRLPDAAGDVVIIGSIVRLVAPLEVGIAFTQMAERDVKRVAHYCREQLRAMHDFRFGSVAHRGTKP